MSRYWTSYWQGKYWLGNKEYAPLARSGGNRFAARGIAPGDFAYVVSVQGGHLFLGGRMQIDAVVSRSEATLLSGGRNLYPADEWLVARKGTGTPLMLHRRLTLELARELRFISKRKTTELAFKSPGLLDGQTLRTVRELVPASADLLDKAIEVSDRLSRKDGLIIVSRKLLGLSFASGPELNRTEDAK
jgi:hypothetical protein